MFCVWFLKTAYRHGFEINYREQNGFVINDYSLINFQYF